MRGGLYWLVGVLNIFLSNSLTRMATDLCRSAVCDVDVVLCTSDTYSELKQQRET